MELDISFVGIKLTLNLLWAYFRIQYEKWYDYLYSTSVGSLIFITTIVYKLSGGIMKNICNESYIMVITLVGLDGTLEGA